MGEGSGKDDMWRVHSCATIQVYFLQNEFPLYRGLEQRRSNGSGIGFEYLSSVWSEIGRKYPGETREARIVYFPQNLKKEGASRGALFNCAASANGALESGRDE
ncbi:MAG TPA: hypothetical protein VIX89_16150 [Bryobacteraceae bacterium]